MKMRDLIAQSGVSRTAIHYYQREHLLPAARKTAPNAASYDQSHLDRLVLLTRLRERGLGIDQIRNVLKWAADGADPQVAASLELALSCGVKGNKSYNLKELSLETGVSIQQVKRLHSGGHLGADQMNSSFDGFDREAVCCLGKLLELGVEVEKIENTASEIEKIIASDMSEAFERAATMSPADRASYFLNLTENMDKLTRYFVLMARQKTAVRLTGEARHQANTKEKS